jgi:hypothetical protein
MEGDPWRPTSLTLVLMMEAVHTSEISDYFDTTRRYIAEGCHIDFRWFSPFHITYFRASTVILNKFMAVLERSEAGKVSRQESQKV